MSSDIDNKRHRHHHFQKVTSTSTVASSSGLIVSDVRIDREISLMDRLRTTASSLGRMKSELSKGDTDKQDYQKGISTSELSKGDIDI